VPACENGRMMTHAAVLSATPTQEISVLDIAHRTPNPAKSKSATLSPDNKKLPGEQTFIFVVPRRGFTPCEGGVE
jgi:hypothetical protein